MAMDRGRGADGKVVVGGLAIDLDAERITDAVQCIGEIRRVLGEDGKGLVETVPRRGYRPPGSPVRW